jgi:hypothetical protein
VCVDSVCFCHAITDGWQLNKNELLECLAQDTLLAHQRSTTWGTVR